MKFSPTALSLIITTSKINAAAGQALPSGWTDLGAGKCVDNSGKEFNYAVATTDGNTCTFSNPTKETCAEFCQCFMTHWGGINAMKGASYGILPNGHGTDCSCYHDSSWDCNTEVKVNPICFPGSGATGSITGTVPKDASFFSQDCLQFTPSQATGAPIASVNPTKAPTTTSPTTTSSPTKVLAYTPLNGIDGGNCRDSTGTPYSSIYSYEIGTDDYDTTCIPFTNHTYAFAYCSDWCRGYLPSTYIGFEVEIVNTTGCWDCNCLFDDQVLANVTDETLKLYDPTASGWLGLAGTGPISKTELFPTQPATCYKLIDPTSAPTGKPIAITSAPTGKPIATTSAPTGKPIATTSAPTGKPIAITSAPTGKPIAITSAPTGNPIATTSAPTGNPIATTSAPTGKPTAASKSSKGVKATKVPSAKSSKSAKRV